MTLFDVGVEGDEIAALLAEAEGELTPELEARLDAFIAGGKTKLESAAKVLRMLDHSQKACEDEATRLKARAGSFTKQSDNLKARILFAVDNGFDGKVKTDLFTIWGQTSAETVSYDLAPDVDISILAKQRPGLVRTTYALNKSVLANEVKAGASVPPEVTATVSPGTRYLRVK